MNQKQKVHTIVEGAVMVALAFILSFIILWKMPWGGEISLNMLPIILYACRRGPGPGFLSGFALGALLFIASGGIALGWQSIIGDYLLAYAVLGLAGLFRRKKSSVFIGTIVGASARFLVHFVVGATIWAAYMPPVLFGMTMTSPWFYSFLYNGFYMLIDTLLCLLVFALLRKPMGKYLTAEDIQKA